MATDWLCTVDQAKGEIKEESDQAADDYWLRQNIPLVSTRINNYTRTRFIPWKEEYRFDAFGSGIDDVYRQLDLGNRPLLQPLVVIDALGNSLVQNTDYVTVPQDNPAYQLQMTNNNIYGWSFGQGYGMGFWVAPIIWQRAIKVTGIWGYRTFYPQEGWTDSLQALLADMDASQRTFTVTTVDDFNADAQIPAISIGHVFQIGGGDTLEWMQCVNIVRGDSDATISVIRGLNGTDAQAHDEGDKIYTWSVQPEINRAATRWLGYWFARRGNFEKYKSDYSQGKAVSYPSDMPEDVKGILDLTCDWRWGTV